MEIRVEDNENVRIDKYIADKTDYTRSKIQKLINSGNVVVKGKVVKANYKVSLDDEIVITLEEEDTDIEPENISLDIVYEDEYLLVVNKPSGMVVHPAAGNYHHTLVNALMYHCNNNLSRVNGEVRPGIVHRIDADTSGLLLVAKNDMVHNNLAKQISEKTVKRKYICLVHGVIKEDSATIDAPIGRDKFDRKKMCVTDENSKDAITHIRVIDRYKDSTLIECSLETGRTHQIRVHMNYINHPVVNDPVYGYNKLDDKEFGQMLHAKEIGFIHPVTKEFMDFTVPVPDRFKEILEIYKNKE